MILSTCTGLYHGGGWLARDRRAAARGGALSALDEGEPRAERWGRGRCNGPDGGAVARAQGLTLVHLSSST